MSKENKAAIKQKQRQQIEEDNIALNWRASAHLLNLARDKRPTSPITSPITSPRGTSRFPTDNKQKFSHSPAKDTRPARSQVFVKVEHHECLTCTAQVLTKYKKENEKDWKHLQEFWRKLTNKRDAKSAKYNLNALSSIWYIIWTSNWRPKTMAKSFETLEAHFEAHKEEGLLTNEQSTLSHFYAMAWDSSRLGILSWEDFSFGFVVACSGSSEVASRLLFSAIDATGEGYVGMRDIQRYARMLFVDDMDITTKMVTGTVEAFFSMIDKSAFDTLDIDEFLTITEDYPESLLGAWSAMLNYFVRYNSKNREKKYLFEPEEEVETEGCQENEEVSLTIQTEESYQRQRSAPRLFLRSTPSGEIDMNAGETSKGRFASPRSSKPTASQLPKRSSKGFIISEQKKRSLKRKEGTGWGRAVSALEEDGNFGTQHLSQSATSTPRMESSGKKYKRSKSGGKDEVSDEDEEGKTSRRRPLMKSKTADHKRVK
eukprot:TRINITY_DN1425_c0_g1_i1.p1 TRINITY_DN1425_c0_g1~~TRINITY_DN1425_c0_g1_i1.p1  ORF type:complete len:486 (-),score=91.91 TRINITY_DN1425_c0_g1_i1:58-1515(-)